MHHRPTKAHFRLDLTTPAAYHSPGAAVLAHLFAQLISDELNEYSYHAQVGTSSCAQAYAPHTRTARAHAPHTRTARAHAPHTRTARAAHMHCACTAYTQVAGLDYLVSNTSSGLSIRVEGYSHRLPLMITKVVTRLAEAQLCPERFAVQVSEP